MGSVQESPAGKKISEHTEARSVLLEKLLTSVEAKIKMHFCVSRECWEGHPNNEKSPKKHLLENGPVLNAC